MTCPQYSTMVGLAAEVVLPINKLPTALRMGLMFCPQPGASMTSVVTSAGTVTSFSTASSKIMSGK